MIFTKVKYKSHSITKVDIHVLKIVVGKHYASNSSVVDVYVFNKKLSNFIPNFILDTGDFIKHNITKIIDIIKHNIEMVTIRCDFRTQYYHESGRDCDGVTSSCVHKYKNALQAYEAIESAYNWADGPVYFTKITKAQYDTFEPVPSRDLVLEAFENGHPHIIYT